MSSNRYSYNMHSLSEHQTDKGNRKFSGGGGDYTLDRRNSNASVFLEEPTFSDDPAEWNKADYKYNIQFLKKYITNQKRYLKQEEENFARNNELIANMKSSQQIAKDECIRKKSEIQRTKNEIEDFKTQIRKNVETNNNIRSQLLCEQEVNRDVKKQIKRLTKRRELLLRKQTEEGISDDIIEAYESAKELLESEKERKERLMKKDNWYTTEIATIRDVLANEDGNTKLDGIEIEKVSQDEEQDNCTSNNNINYFLPDCNKIRACVRSPEAFVESAGPFKKKYMYIQREAPRGHTSKVPAVLLSNEKFSHQATVEDEIEAIHYLPNIENNYGCSFRSPEVVAIHGGYIPHPPTIADTDVHIQHPFTATATSARVHRALATLPKQENVPHLPTVVATKENVPHPPSGKKDGAFRRFYRKLKSVIK